MNQRMYPEDALIAPLGDLTDEARHYIWLREKNLNLVGYYARGGKDFSLLLSKQEKQYVEGYNQAWNLYHGGPRPLHL
eukprot:4692359-Karenia_brevis.AAC.1